MSFVAGAILNASQLNDLDVDSLVVDTDTLVVDKTNDRVGIGTTSPNHLLSFGTPPNGSRQIGLYENGTAYYGFGTDVNRLAIYASNSAGTEERVTVTSDGDVGIGTTAPISSLHIAQPYPEIILQDNNASAATNGSLAWTGSGGAAIGRIDFDGTNDMRIYSAENDTAGNTWFSVAGGFRMNMATDGLHPYDDNVYDLGWSGKRYNDAYVTNGVTTGSDERDKKDIRDLDLGLDFINRLRPVSWVWNDRSGQVGVREHMGLVAQELAAVLGDQATNRGVWINSPASSVEGADGEIIESPEHQGIRYCELFGPLIKAVQELAGRVAALEVAA